MITQTNLIGKKAYIESGWNFNSGEVAIVKDNDEGVCPAVDVQYVHGEIVTFDKAFIERRIIG